MIEVDNVPIKIEFLEGPSVIGSVDVLVFVVDSIGIVILLSFSTLFLRTFAALFPAFLHCLFSASRLLPRTWHYYEVLKTSMEILF